MRLAATRHNRAAAYLRADSAAWCRRSAVGRLQGTARCSRLPETGRRSDAAASDDPANDNRPPSMARTRSSTTTGPVRYTKATRFRAFMALFGETPGGDFPQFLMRLPTIICHLYSEFCRSCNGFGGVMAEKPLREVQSNFNMGGFLRV